MNRLGIKPEAEFREIQLNAGEVLGPSPGANFVHASKSTVFTFLPQTLVEVLVRPSTIWFVVMILIETNAFSLDYQRSFATCSLFVLHVLLCTLKSVISFHRHHQGDRDYNQILYDVWDQGEFKAKPSAELKVGDCILIKEGGRIPADMVLLSSSSQHGTCYVSIQRNFGESNLVTKFSVPPTYRFLQKSPTALDFNLSRLQAVLKVEPPNPDFSSFSGTVKLPSLPRSVPLKLDHLLTRGSIMRGEDWIIAVIVYAGMETKFWSNVHHSSVRLSFLERKLNNWVIAAALTVAVVVSVHLLLQWLSSEEPVTPGDFVMYILVYQDVVPLTMYIALDFLRLVFALQCRDKKDEVNAMMNCNIEDLGQVEYILADKTGTVTNSELEFVAVLLGNQMYTKFPIFQTGKQDTIPISDDDNAGFTPTNSFGREIILSFNDLKHKMMEDYTEELQRFCECVTLCNSMVVRKDNSMFATNTDEAALMKGAKELGFELISKGWDECDIDYFDMCHSYKVLCVKKFTPDVKRMRILVQQEIDDFATLYIKGAYATLKNMINLPDDERFILEKRIKQMEQKGLRTMILCYRQIDGDYLTEVRIRAMNAMSATLNVEGKLEVLLQELEQNLKFLGVTGVLDHTEEATSLAIYDLSKAGINTWLMSGEGESNTIAAANQLEMIPMNTEVVSIRGLKRMEDCKKRLTQAVSDLLLAVQAEHSIIDAVRFSWLLRGRVLHDQVNFALSIDGESFETAIRQNETQRMLLSLMLTANTVIFNTLSPGQKRQIVNLMHTGIKNAPIVLSIGDEINDIPMVLEANISAGIIGTNVDAASDISVKSFARLAKLILNDGKRFSALACQTVLLFLYSQILYAAVGLTMCYVGEFTPINPRDVGEKPMFGAVFTFFPILYIGCTNLPKTSSPDSEIEQDFFNRHIVRFTFQTTIRCLLLALFHYISIITFLFPSFYSGAASEVSSEEMSFLFLFSMVLSVNSECWWQATSITPALMCIELISTGLVIAFTYGDKQDITTLNVAFATPRLLLGLIGTAIWSFTISSARYYWILMCDLKPLLGTCNKIYPLKVQSTGLKKIKKTSSTALLNVFFRKSQLETGMKTNFEINTKNPTFKGPGMEAEFQRSFLRENHLPLWVLLGILLIIVIFPLTFEIAEGVDQVDLGYKTTIVAAVLFMLLVYSLRNIIIIATASFSFFVVIVIFILNVIFNQFSAIVYFYSAVYLLLFLREKWNCLFPISVFSTIMLMCAAGLNLSINTDPIQYEDVLDIIGAIFAQILSHILAAKICHNRAIQCREQFKLIKHCEERIAESDSILACLLPDFVRKQVKDGIRYIAEDKGQVSVIFIDICYFDQISARYAPQELTALMDDIFQKIDEMCASLHVAKIETVGKTYLACAGLRDFEFEMTGEYIKIPHAKRCLDLAFAVLSSFRNYKLQSEQSLSFKIGINTGEVIAGVVGFHKPQFSLVGDTVNTGSRMSTTIEKPNSVQISESTHKLISNLDDYQFEPRTIPVKGKGEMKTYIVKPTPFNKRGQVMVSESVEEVGPATHFPRQQRGGVRTSIMLDLSEIYARNDKEIIERVNFFTCKRSKLEVAFRTTVLLRDSPAIRLGLALYTLCVFVLFSTRLALLIYEDKDNLGGTVVYVVLACLGIIYVICLNRLLTIRIFPWVLMATYSATTICLSLEIVFVDDLQVHFAQIVMGFMCVLMYHFSGFFFRHAVIGTVVVILPHSLIWMSQSEEMVESAIFMLLFGVQNCVFQYFTERSQRSFYNTSKSAEKEIEKTEQLLTQMIPVQAYENLKNDNWSTDRLMNVSILFADISGFTAWSSRHTPQEVIGKLSKIFTLFDKICVKKRMYKVHTIGDCYVALSSTSNKGDRDTKEECVRMVSFALEMVNVVDEICRQDNEQLKMRIGIHVGEVIGGITGSRIVRYDIYGPDVLVANKMESNGKEGYVNVSAQTKALLEQTAKDEFLFEFNKTVEVREVGRQTDSFFVKSRT